MGEEMRNFVDGISAAAEISLLFYRAVIAAGANPAEAVKTTQAYISALIYGDERNPPDEATPDK